MQSKNKSSEALAVSRAIPGPGEEYEAEPDAGVVDSEKVSVVFLVGDFHRVELITVRASIPSPSYLLRILWMPGQGYRGGRCGSDRRKGLWNV